MIIKSTDFKEPPVWNQLNWESTEVPSSIECICPSIILFFIGISVKISNY